MRLHSLQIKNFRNIIEGYFEPDLELTVIAGANGQGKTNLLESIWLLTGSKSFRGSKDFELVKREEDFAAINGQTENTSKKNKIELLIGGHGYPKKGRFAKVNGVEYGRATEIAGKFTAVVFAPDHLTLVKGGPDGRRRFVDAALCQLYPGYIGILRRFSRALTQKNALLKRYFKTSDADGLLDVFDIEIAQTGTEITRRRAEYIYYTGPMAELFYSEITKGAEELKIHFCPSAEPGGLADLLFKKRSIDIKTGFSTSGPQREDISILVDNQPARVFASQGQQRSAVLSLKLAEAGYAKNITGEHPVLLLDDVLSELDETRQGYLLSRMEDKQSFVTTCDPSAFDRTGGKVIIINKGQIK